jgi:hypothetical protein
MENLRPGTATFQTSNAALAFALHKAGIPFLDPRKPCRNWYSAEMLFRIGGGEKDDDGNVTRSSRYAGMSFEDAAAQAFSDGEKGHVDYLFQHPNGLTKLCAAFADQERQIKEKDIVGIVLLDEIRKKVAEGRMSQQEAMVRSTCIDLKLRGAFLNQWKKQVPMIRIDNPGKVVSEKLPGGGRRDSHPGFKVININLSEKKRKHIGL